MAAAYSQMPAGMYTPQPFYEQGYGGYGGYGSYGGFPASAPPGIQMSPEQKKQAKQMRKQQKWEAAQARSDKLQAQKKLREKKDASNFLIFMSIGFVGLGSLLGATIIGPSWGSKEFTGMGVGLVALKSSLFTMNVHISCDKSFLLETKLCRGVLKKFEGSHDMQRVQGNACAMVPSACGVLGRCYLASIPLFVGIALAVLSSYSAAFCLFTYAKSEADPALRRWAGAFTMATPILTTAGIIAWALMMPDLGEIPRSWSELASQLGVGNALGYEEVHDFQFGWTFFAACLIDFIFIIQAFVWMCMFKRSDDEDEVIRKAAADQAFCDELEEDRGHGIAQAKAPNYGTVGETADAASA